MQNEEELTLSVREQEKKADNDVWQTLKLALGVRLTVNCFIVS